MSPLSSRLQLRALLAALVTLSILVVAAAGAAPEAPKGHPNHQAPADAIAVIVPTGARGVSAFGILYLPVPVIDVFAKAGPARIHSTTSGSAPYPRLFVALHFRFNWTARIRVSQRESGLS